MVVGGLTDRQDKTHRPRVDAPGVERREEGKQTQQAEKPVVRRNADGLACAGLKRDDGWMGVFLVDVVAKKRCRLGSEPNHPASFG